MRSESLALAIGCAVIGAFLAPSPARAGGQYTSVYDVTAASPAVIAEKQPDNSYVYYIREPGGELICRVVGSTKHYYHFDELGSTRAITDDSGSVTDRYSYDAYGALLAHDRNAGSIDQPYQYVGQLGYYTHWQAPEFGRLQLGVRFYDPVTGRFERRDPISSAALSSYGYTDGCPVAASDAAGLAPTYVRCTARQRQQIARQLADIANNRLNCISTRGIRACIGQRLGNVVITCGTHRDPNCAGNDGYTFYPQPRTGITVCPTAFDSPHTCRLQRTLLHEMAHSCDHRPGPPPGGQDSPVGWQCEQDCYPRGTRCPN